MKFFAAIFQLNILSNQIFAIGFILTTIMVIPIFLYSIFWKNKFSFKEWLYKVGFSYTEIIFALIVLFLIACFGYIPLIYGYTFSLYILGYFSYKKSDKSKYVKIGKPNKKYLLAFLVIFIIYNVYSYLLSNFTSFFRHNNALSHFLSNSPFLLSTFLIYLFGIKFKDFNWRINIKTLIIVIILFLFTKCFLIFVSDYILFHNLSFLCYIKNFGLKIYHPGFDEEFIIRGLLLTWLIQIGLRSDKANIIQAVFFGLWHLSTPIFLHHDISIILVLQKSIQTFMGYLLGKLYLQTKSLTPGVLLHALYDMAL